MNALVHWTIGSDLPRPAGRFIALVPGEKVPLLPVDRDKVPDGLRGAPRVDVARRWLTNLLRPAAGRLDLRPAPFGAGDDGWTRLLVADPVDLAQWRAALGADTARVRAMLPDYLALPAAPGLWVLAADGQGRVRARLGPDDGFSAETGLAAQMLTRARRRGPAPRAVLVLAPPLPAEVLAALEGLPVAESPDRLPPDVPRPQAFALGEGALDLRHDPGTRAAALAARLRALVLPLVLAAAGAAGWAGAVLHETAALRAQAAATETATLAAVRRDILPTGPLLDIRLQVAREIARRQEAVAGGTAQAGGLVLLHMTAEGLTEAGTVPQGLRLLPEGRVEIDLVLPDFAALDRAVARLRAAGLEVGVQRSGSLSTGEIGAGLLLSAATTSPAAPPPEETP